MQASTSMKREAFVLIHGMDGRTPGEILAKLERGILSSTELSQKRLLPNLTVGESTGKVLQVRTHRQPHADREIHLFESFWGDKIVSLTKRPIREQIVRGLALIAYWIRTPVRKSGNRYIAYGGVLSAFGLIFWWYGLVITGLNAAALPSGQTLSSLIQETTAGWTQPWSLLGTVVEYATSWWLALGTLLLGGSFSILIDSTVNILNFIHRYLENDNVRQGIWQRLSQLVRDLEDSGCYDRITLLSHSFGTVIHVDFMADYTPSPSAPPLRHITLGGPVGVMALRADKIRQRMCGALASPVIRAHPWVDYFSDLDWMCTAMPDASEQYSFGQASFQETGRNIEHRRIEITDASLLKKLTGSYHTRYFEDPGVIAELLS